MSTEDRDEWTDEDRAELKAAWDSTTPEEREAWPKVLANWSGIDASPEQLAQIANDAHPVKHQMWVFVLWLYQHRLEKCGFPTSDACTLSELGRDIRARVTVDGKPLNDFLR